MDFNRNIFADRLRQLMDENNDTVYSLGDSVFLSPGTVSKYLNEKIDPRRNTIESLAKHYRVNPIWLMGSDKVDRYLENDVNKFVKIPILNDPKNTKDIIGYEYINSKLKVKYCVYTKDDSMVNARILTSDLLYINTDVCISGDIAIVEIDNEIMIKRLHKTNDLVILKSDNLSNPDERVFTKKEMKSIEILGKVIMFRSEIR